MYGLHVEYRRLHGSMSRDLARQIYVSGTHSKIAVVADRPLVLLSTTKKEWVKLIRQAHRERSSTLDVTMTTKLTEQIAWMQKLKFSAKPPDDLLEADVTFATAKTFVRIPPICPVIYVTYKFDKLELHMLTSWMPKGGRVVIYE